VLLHELAHALVDPQLGLSRELEETAVEAVSFLASSAAGLDTACDSVPYIASWGDEDAVEHVRRAAALIDELARRIEAAIEPQGEPATAA
jgi:hypothetical protein